MNSKSTSILKKTTKHPFTLIAFLLLLSQIILLSPLAFAADAQGSGAEKLREYGFIKGVGGDLLLAKSLTRAEVAVLMADMRGKKSEAEAFSKKSGFADVSEKEWYAAYIAYGKSKGYLGGYPDGTFKPEASVSAQEFAAFLMNALGYNGDYEYTQVVGFATAKQVPVVMKGYSFVRGDAFEAMWAAVNQPSKGSKTPLGVTLGRFKEKTPEVVVNPTPTPTPTPLPAAKLEYSVKAISTKAFEVKFTAAVEQTEGLQFALTQLLQPVTHSVKWNESKTAAVLSVNNFLTEGFYEMTLTDARKPDKKVYDLVQIKHEKEKIAKVVFDKDTVTRMDDNFATARFTTYNQYDEVITNTAVGRRLQFVSSTSVFSPLVEYSSGVVTIQHGTPGQNTLNLSLLPSVTLILTDPISGFSSSQTFKVGMLSNAIREVRINGIVDEEGRQTDFVYIPGKAYYLDAYVLDADGNTIRSASLLSAVAYGRENMMVTLSATTNLTITKMAHPTRPNEIAFRITFNGVPTTDVSVMFTAVVPIATQKNVATFVTTLKVR